MVNDHPYDNADAQVAPAPPQLTQIEEDDFDSKAFSPAAPEFTPSMSTGRVTPENLLDAMGEDDLQVIVNGFRAASQMPDFPPEVAAGFVRFAEVLERLGS